MAKGDVANGELSEYERGEIDWEVLLKDYRGYGLPLPVESAELVALPREIWVIEPLRVWHLGFPLPPHAGGGEEQPRRYLVGADVFTSGQSTIRAMDRKRADGTIEKAKQFEPDKLVEKWDGDNLEALDFIFHGQDRADLDTNALFVTALQLRHLGDARARRLMEESLRFDVDIWDYWESDFVQPAGWTPRQILAECAWRAWVNRWYRGQDGKGEAVGKLRPILPQVAASSRATVEELMRQIDPKLPERAGDGTLAGALIEFGLRGGDWPELVAKAKADPTAFETLLGMLGDDRVFPFRKQAHREFECAVLSRRTVRAWYSRDRFRRVSDYAAMLLNEVCDRALMGTNSTSTPEFMRKYIARAEFWNAASQQNEPGRHIRENWFTGEAGDRRLNLPAIELQANADFEELAAQLPLELGTVTAAGVADLSRIIAHAHELHVAKLDWSKFPEERKQRQARLVPQLYLQLYEKSAGNSAEVRSILLRMALPYEENFEDGEEAPTLVAAALERISRVPDRIEKPYASCDAAAIGELPTRSRTDVIWEPFLQATREAPPGLAIEWIGRALGEKWYSDHPSRDQQFRYAFGLLDDRRVRRIDDEPWRHTGARASEFRQLCVGDYSATHLGRKLKLPWHPQPSWSDADWRKFRQRVGAALLRLDAQRYCGIINRR